jgi:uncharacterized glyoxalase superfamily protein PhnB
MEDATSALVVGQVNLIVQDVARSVAFYRRLGLAVEAASAPEWSIHHASVVMANGVRLELDSVTFAQQWNPGMTGGAGSTGCVLFFTVQSPDKVDELFGRMASAGCPVQKSPEDAFWGARYAIIEDPDGNSIGIMSGMDRSRRFPPPPAPSGGR